MGRGRGAGGLRRPTALPRAEREALAEEQRLRAVAGALARSGAAREQGERLVAAALEPLRAEGWHLFHGLPRPGHPRENLDHVAVGPGGVVVAGTEVWCDPVEVRGGVPRQNGRRKRASVAAVAAMTGDVAALLPPHLRDLVQGAVLLVAQDQAPIASEKSPVVVVGRSRVVGWCASLPAAMGEADISAVAGRLQQLWDTPVAAPAAVPVAAVLPAPAPAAVLPAAVLPAAVPPDAVPGAVPMEAGWLAGARARTRSRGRLPVGLKLALAASLVLTALAWSPELTEAVAAGPSAVVDEVGPVTPVPAGDPPAPRGT